MKRKITAGSRGSRLAITQTESVINLIKRVNPGLDTEIEKIVTSGDRDRVTSLDRSGVDVFVKELEEALLDGRIDLAVHSLKDVPTEIPHGLKLVAVTKRADPRDVLVAKSQLEDLPPGDIIGTGSLRRSIQLHQIRPDVKTISIRGNVDTRLGKISRGEVDGIIMAAAALLRLGWQDKITQYLPVSVFLPAAGQGALVVETREDDQEIINLISLVNHQPTWQCVIAERTFLQELGGGCHAPVAALGTIEDNTIRLEGMVAEPEEKKVLRDAIEGNAAFPASLGIKLAKRMAGMGAAYVIAEARRNETR